VKNRLQDVSGTIEAIMPNAEDIERFLRTSSDRAYCDDCLTMLMGFSSPAEAEGVSSGLAEKAGFIREQGECCLCHERKQTTRSR
jgi:hypothetical protein